MKRSELTPAETDTYFGRYMNRVHADFTMEEALMVSQRSLNDVVNGLSEEQLNFRYAEGKWTIKEVVVHLTDTERILTYRALRFARRDRTPLPGFEQDDYMPYCGANERSIVSIMDENNLLRENTLCMFSNFTEDMMLGKGIASGTELTARSLGFVVAGHTLHHLAIIKERYLG